jgi:hypothetical protein
LVYNKGTSNERRKKMKVKIGLNTMTDIRVFVDRVSSVEEDVILKDNTGHCVNAKSLLGAVYTMEWTDVYCECKKDISGRILPWIV